MTAPVPLRYPLSGLLAEPAGTERRYEIHGATIGLPDDLRLTEPIDGRLKVTRTNRGVIIDADLTTAIAATCSRCLRDTESPMRIEIHEEVLPAIDIASGRALDRDSEPEVARLTDHHELDFGVLAGEAISLNEPIAPLCEPDCPGLCITCGERLGPTHVEHDDVDVDPRLAALQAFRVDGEGESE
jgi:Predicted metal-binding, possibly nucleic acid-binding protein